jgi:capsular polysaccharide transport system permease protein
MLDEAAKNAVLPVKAGESVLAEARKPMRAAARKSVPDVKAPAEENSKVVHIVRRLQEDAGKRSAHKRGFWLPVSLAVAILVPTLLASIYYGLIAADQYVSEARFAVRTSEQQAADVLGMVTGMPGATVVSDSYIVTDYVGSREMVEALEKRLPLREIYANSNADFLTRLDPVLTIEQLVEYWNRRIDVFFDPAKNTITVRAQAFVPEDAEKIVSEIVDIARALVNDLSAQARRDAVQFAAGELARAELRVRGARDNMLAFRSENRQFDPAATAEATLGIVGKLDAEQSALKSQLAALSGYLSADAPSIQMLRSRIDALEAESNRIQDGIAEGEESESGVQSGALAGVLAEYQELLLDQEFAETAYTAALGSLERARTEADRQQAYLAIYVHPSVAEEATYPRRLLSIFVVLVLSFVIWAIGALAVLTVRDHMH